MTAPLTLWDRAVPFPGKRGVSLQMACILTANTNYYDRRFLRATPLKWELRALADLLPHYAVLPLAYGNTAQLRQRISADLLHHFCSFKNGKYIQYSPVFETLNWHKISR